MRTPLLYAGMLAARELTRVLSGEPLGVTLCEVHDGEPEFTYSEGFQTLLGLFEANTGNAECASLVHHGTVTFTDGTICAAVLMRATTADSVHGPFVVGLPYRPPDHPNGFAVHGPVVLSDGLPEETVADWVDTLFEGFETENPNLWNEYGEDLESPDSPGEEGA